MSFQIHTIESAPAPAKPMLEGIKNAYGFIPNLAGVFAQSPGTMGYLSASMTAFDSDTMLLSALERQVALLAVSVANRCRYCTSAHSMLAANIGLSRNDVEALQDNEPLSDSKLQTLRLFVEHIVESSGWVEPKMLSDFKAAGFGEAHVLELVAAVSLKTLTNYANHIAEPEINEQFSDFIPKWEK